MHIELTEMLRCPEPHREGSLVLSTGEMSGRMVRFGVVGCPVCHREYEVVEGIVHFGEAGSAERGAARSADGSPAAPGSRLQAPDAQTLQALLDLSGPGGYVVLLAGASRSAVSLAALMGGIHFVGINPPADLEELPVLSLIRSPARIPLRQAMARGVVAGADMLEPGWLAEGVRVLLRGRRLVVQRETVEVSGVRALASGDGLWVGEKE